VVSKNTKDDKLSKDKKFAKGDTSYSSFWLYNRERDVNSEHFKDSFVNFYSNKELLSEFNPTTTKNIISFWSQSGDLILDPFSGRTRALVSHAMNRMYVGFEVSSDVVSYMDAKFCELGLKGDKNFNVDIVNDDCKHLSQYYGDVEFDMVFTCPPYWNLEKYESCNGQLSDITDYNVFLTELVSRLVEAFKRLKIGGYMCVVVGDFRRKGEYITFHSDLLQSLKSFDCLKLHDVVTIQNIPFNTAAFYFGSRKKHKYTTKSHEYLLVWKKVS